jgi:ABC-type phosphate transport system substrate-binding protein
MALFCKRQVNFLSWFLCLNLCWAGGLVRAGDTDGAPAFSDPDDLAPVDAGWEALPVKHEARDSDADLVLALGQQSYPIYKELIAEYARKHNLKIVIQPGTCGITAGKLRKKIVDLGAFCCPPGKNDRLPGVEFISLGISPIALITHPDNPVDNVSTQQAREIFSGDKSQWTELDPTNGKPLLEQDIQPIARLHCKPRPGHWRLLLKNEDQFSSRLFEVGVIPDMISQVAKNPRAIGYEVPLMTVVHRDKGQVKMLNIDGHSPTDLDYVLQGKYPLYRSYHLVVWKDDSEANRQALKLVDFMIAHMEKNYQKFWFIPPSKLKQAGWKFRGKELVGEPSH